MLLPVGPIHCVSHTSVNTQERVAAENRTDTRMMKPPVLFVRSTSDEGTEREREREADCIAGETESHIKVPRV